MVGILIAGLMFYPSPATRAADHRDAPTVDSLPEGDITDVVAFLDPNDSSKLVLIMNVNPFSVPAEKTSHRFSTEFLYQFKIDNTGDAVEDLVIQVLFSNSDRGQTVEVFGPRTPRITGARAIRPRGSPTISGPTEQVLTDSTGQIQVFAGQRDDPFVTDVGQLMRILTASQDVFRGFTSPALGALQGRPVRVDGTSGVDGFGGFNISSIQIELPKSILRGATSEINVWGTVSRPLAKDNDDGANRPAVFLQFERMGQQLFSIVFVPQPLKDFVNNTVPADDVENFSSLIPDALTRTDNDGTGNTIAGRVAVLNAVGVLALPNGAPLLLPADFPNDNKDLIRLATLPDVLRLDLDVLPPDDLQIGLVGSIPTIALQNGRRPGDDVPDILLRLTRQLADVKFPDGSGLPGSGPRGMQAALRLLGSSAVPRPARLGGSSRDRFHQA